jgi:probable rRNA maturation factor
MPEGSSTLLFQHPAPGVRRGDLRRFLDNVAARVVGGPGVTCVITTDAHLRALNRKFRGKDYATDVLSFPGAAGDGTSGELAISLDRAKAQAKELGHSTELELRILILHGLLHLAGMDHETDSGEMARSEVRWRKRLGLPAGLIERATGRRGVIASGEPMLPGGSVALLKFLERGRA